MEYSKLQKPAVSSSLEFPECDVPSLLDNDTALVAQTMPIRHTTNFLQYLKML